MSKFIARTGRVQNWIDNPESRLPVSCTVFNVEDSMEGPEGIEASWRFASHALRFGAGCAIHLSSLRPRGDENGKGLTASGPLSFAKIYSTLNEILRRGGHYKNGAIVIHMDGNHADIDEFLTASRAELPWVKRCVDVDQEIWDGMSDATRALLYRGIQSGDIWLNKIKYDANGERIFGNVCLEIYLKSRGTCLLEHVNLGQCSPGDLVQAFSEGMASLVALHGKTGVGESGEYLSPEVDRQVGLGMLGLANFLAIHGVSYAAFGEALYEMNHGIPYEITPAHTLANEFRKAIAAAAGIARANGMERAFTIAPTASCSYRYTDLDGNTTCPEIAPPIARDIDRDSGTFGVESFSYGDVEIAEEVGWDAYKRVAEELCRLMANTGLFHGYSFNSWSDVVTYDADFIEDWLQSPLTSLYYALQIKSDTLRKDDASAILDEDYKDIFGFDVEEDDNFCSSCAE